MPACVYSGTISPHDFAQYTSGEIEKYMIPVKFTRVKDKMTALQKTPNPKVNTFFMKEVLEENPDWIVDTFYEE